MTIGVRWLCMMGAAGLATAWQGGLPQMNLTDSTARKVALDVLGESQLPSLSAFLSKPVVDACRAKPPAERVQLASQAAAYAKRLVSSPEFEAAYNVFIGQRYRAVDHGLKIDPRAEQAKAAAMATPAGAQQAMNQAHAEIAKAFEAIPVPQIKMMFDQDLASWKTDRRKSKLAARAESLLPLYSSSPDQFRKQYTLLKIIDMGGPDTMAELDKAKAGAASADAERKAREEQSSFDQRRLKPVLKQRLLAFISQARTVDYSAQTEVRKGVPVFVNPAYERKPSAWKMLYRLGKEPSMALAQFAEQWVKEL